MRIGSYEERLQSRQLEGHALHRVILPIFIPRLEEYFERALEVLDLCLTSLQRSLDRPVAISLVANGCCTEVVKHLQTVRDQGWIDQLVIHAENRGKVDAAVSVARGSFEPLLTISDSDTLFLPGWLEAVESTFRAFPEAGAVAPIPNPRGVRYHTTATMLGARLRGELSWQSVVPREDLDKFAASVGQPSFYSPEHYDRQLVVEREGHVACVGAGHFSVTLRREMVEGMPKGPSLVAVSGVSEELWMDEPVDRLGAWRLSTARAFVRHIGNIPENWMAEEIEGSGSTPAPADHVPLPPLRTSPIPYWVRRGLRRLSRQLGRTWL